MYQGKIKAEAWVIVKEKLSPDTKSSTEPQYAGVFHSPGQRGFLRHNFTPQPLSILPKALWEGADSLFHTASSFRDAGGFHSPCLLPQQLQRTGHSCSHPRTGAPPQKAYRTHRPSPSHPNAKYTREQQASTLHPWDQHITVQSQLKRDIKNRAAS